MRLSMMMPLRMRMPRSLHVLACALAAGAAFPLASSAATCEEAAAAQDPALSPNEYREFRVRKVESLTHNTKRITFALPRKDDEMGLLPASCLLVRANVQGKTVVRPYTPTNLNDERGKVELVVKEYPQGKMSAHLAHLQVGDAVAMKGPLVKFKYEANQYKQIGMIAGGTGITPMLQLVRQICRDPADTTRITLLCANVSEQDMLLREELDALQFLYPQLTVQHVLSAPSEQWKGRRGFVSSEMVKELMPAPSEADILICVCGPPGMMLHVSGDKAPDRTQGELQGVLKELQYSTQQVFKF